MRKLGDFFPKDKMFSICLTCERIYGVKSVNPEYRVCKPDGSPCHSHGVCPSCLGKGGRDETDSS